MQLLPEELRHKLPRLGDRSDQPIEEMTVYTRFFDPTSNWKWYVLAYDGEDTFFGLVVTTGNALAGHFKLSELRALRYRHETLGEVGVERDTYFRPLLLRDLIQKEPVLAQALQSSGLDLLGLDPGA